MIFRWVTFILIISFSSLVLSPLTVSAEDLSHTKIENRFKRAMQAHEKNHLDEAATLFKSIAKESPQTPNGAKAAELYLTILKLQNKTDNLRSDSLRLSRNKAFEKSYLEKFLNIHKETAFKISQNFEDIKQYDKAITSYLDFIRDNPQSDFADQALYNAIRCANSKRDINQVALLIETLLDNYPHSGFYEELSKNLLIIYEAQAQLKKAAKVILKTADSDPTKKWKKRLLAADYLALDNDWDSAAQIYRQIADKALTKPEWPYAVERLYTHAQKQNRGFQATRFLEQLTNSSFQPHASLAGIKLAQSSFDSGHIDTAVTWTKKVFEMKTSKNVSPWAIAQASLLMGRILESDFDRVLEKSKHDSTPKALKATTEMLDRVQKAYQETIAINDRSTTTEALFHLGRCYGKYAVALRKMNSPTALPVKEKLAFNTEISKISSAIDEKRIEILTQALNQARRLERHDGLVPKIQGELNQEEKRRISSEPRFEMTKTNPMIPVVN